jgi:hypothetical protein
MTTLAVLAVLVPAALVVAAVAHASRSRENKGPIELGVGRKLRSYELRLKGGDCESRRPLSL